MGVLDFFRGLFSGLRKAPPPKPMDDGAIETAFQVVPVTSQVMKDNIQLWYALYTNEPPWQTDCVHPLGLPGAIGREFARNTLSEFNIAVDGARGEFLQNTLDLSLVPNLRKYVELGLCLGGVAFRPYVDARGRLMVSAASATAFSPIEFDGAGRAISGVFREVTEYDHQTYTRLEYHGWDGELYVVQNKVYSGDTGGGQELPLNTVPKWAALAPEVRIANLEGPLFSYFRNPVANDIEPDSQVGVSIYGGKANVDLIRQADVQWERMLWEFKSGERKIFNDGPDTKVSQFDDRLFQKGLFTAEGNLFNVFSPEFRHTALYDGFQWILQRIEYNVGLSFGTISDPQSVEKTATEILAAKNRQRVTVTSIQRELEATINGLVYALDTYATLYSLTTQGEYEVTFNWGDGVLDDPDTVRQNKAQDLQEVAAGIMNPWEYRVKWYGETEDEAKANLPEAESMTDTQFSAETGMPDDVPLEPSEPLPPDSEE